MELLAGYGSGSDDEADKRDASPARGASTKRSRSRSPPKIPEIPGLGDRFKGKVLTWELNRGFGFIQPDDGSEKMFVHYSAIKDGTCLRVGDPVEYTKTFDKEQKKLRATNVNGGYKPNAVEKVVNEEEAATQRGDCLAFRNGKCKRGAKCPYSHANPPPKKEKVQQYVIYRCPRWDDPPDAPMISKHKPRNLTN